MLPRRALSTITVFSLALLCSPLLAGDSDKTLFQDPAPSFGGPPACMGDATNLFFPLDATYTLVDFCGDGASGSGSAVCPDQHNDDDSATVPLPFTFNLYGDTYDTVFVNNNGNLSFGMFFSTFSSSPFPSSIFAMVAPFWGDVDTGNASNTVGEVYMKFFDGDGNGTDDTLVVTWDNVGYFNENGDLRNTFQVAISDGASPLLGPGNNVCFSYDNMCWTTGDASGGSGGFGGTPSTVGANRGDGVNFFQIGRFDQPGDAYDGPFDMNDGVDFLDGQTICFSTDTAQNNIAPIPTNLPAVPLVVDAGQNEVLSHQIDFLSPEAGQTTTVVVNDPDGAQSLGLLIGNVPGNVASVTLDWAPECTAVGVYTIEFVATDDFSPPGQTMASLTIEITCTLPPFVRGDCDGNGSITILDPLTLLFFAILGAPVPGCLGACDGDASGTLNIADALLLLTFQFGSGPTPEDPFPECGVDLSPDALACAGYTACP